MSYTGHGETLREAMGGMVAQVQELNYASDVRLLAESLLELDVTAKSIDQDLSDAVAEVLQNEVRKNGKNGNGSA